MLEWACRPREKPPTDILRRKRSAEAEVGKVFGEEQGSSVPGRRLAAGGSQEGGAGKGILARKLLPFPAAFHRRFFGAGENHRLLVLESEFVARDTA